MIERDWRGGEREKERKRETVGHPSSLIGRLHWEFVIQIETRILPDIKQLQIKSIIASVDKRERARGRGRERGEGGSCSAAFEANESTCFCGCGRLQIAGFLPLLLSRENEKHCHCQCQCPSQKSHKS